MISDTEKRINELLTQNNILRQENHNVKEEIFDLKMCMATSEVESTAALMKELNALKSQLSFKVCGCVCVCVCDCANIV
jgi:ribosomal protein L29